MGDVSFTSDNLSSIPLKTTMAEYCFNGLSSGVIEISYKVTSGAVFFKDITISIEGKSGYEWNGNEQAVSFISYLKTFVGSCYPGFADKRKEVAALINEYNLLLEEAKLDNSFNELFDDNGYIVTALEKLKMMVDQYNKSLKEGEIKLVLELPEGNFNGESNVALKANQFNKQALLILVIASLLSIIFGVSFFAIKKKRR